MNKALVVLSGGQDSTTCAAIACQEFKEVHAVTFDYGQRHAIEIESAKAIAEQLNLASHEIIDMGAILKGRSPLVSDNQVGQYNSVDELPEGVEPTFVEGRNLLFLTLAANRAAVLGITDIFMGVCESDFAGYWDCRQKFIDATAIALSEAIYGRPDSFKIHTPLMSSNKADSVHLAKDVLGDRFDEIFLQTHTCFPAGALVHAEQGLVPIEQVQEGELVYSHTGVLRKVVATMQRDYEGDLLAVNVYGAPIIQCTPDHPFFTTNGFIEADNLELSSNDCLIPQIPVTPLIKGYSGAFDLTSEFALFLGLFAAEGSYLRDKQRQAKGIDLSLNSDELCHPLVFSIVDWLKSITNSKVTTVPNSHFESGVNIKFWDSQFAGQLAELIGSGNDVDRFYECVLGWDQLFQFEFLKGYLFGDGFYNHRTNIMTASGINLRLLNVIYSVMVQQGRTPTLDRITAINCNGNHDQYQVRLRLVEWTELAAEAFGIRLDRLPKRNDCFVKPEGRKVRSIERSRFLGVVYNLTVEGDESYIVNSVPVHNCYNGVKGGCGKCHACHLRDRGFKEANVIDPIWQFRYENSRC